MEFTIEELPIPAALDGSPAALDFEATIAVRNAIENELFPGLDLAFTPAELLHGWQDQTHEPKILLGARVGGRIVARGLYDWRHEGEAVDTAWQYIQVLAGHRGHGIGRALADRLEALAIRDGRKKILTWFGSPERPGERLVPLDGVGSIPADDPGVRFALGRGFRLELITRASLLALPVDRIDERLAAATEASGDEYRVHRWDTRTPEHWREAMAHLITRMSTDAPSAGLEEPEDPWTVERLVDYEQGFVDGGLAWLVAAIEHVPSGALVAFTELEVPAQPARPIHQGDTIVLREHRGRRLGMRVKLENLAEVQRRYPDHRGVVTFNAEQNRHMLDVNEAVGFVPAGYEGAWRKDLG